MGCQRQHHPARQADAVIALEQKRHAALAGLTVDADHRLIVTADIARIDRQVSDLPRLVRLLLLERLADRVLVAAREGGVDHLADPRMTRMDRNVGAVVDHLDDLVRPRQVQLRIDALAVEVHCQGDDVHVAGALAVAQQRAFDALGAGQQRQLCGSHRAAAIIVRMNGDDHAVAILDVLAEILDLIGMVVRPRHFHRGRQVEDALVVRGGLPHIHDRFADPQREIDLGAGEALRGVFETPLHFRIALGIGLDPGGALHRDIDDAIAIHLEHPLALNGRCRVVQVHDGPLGADEGLEGLLDQMLAALHQHGDGHVLRDLLFLDQPAHEIVVRLARRRKPDHHLLDAHLDDLVPEALLLLDAHRLQ